MGQKGHNAGQKLHKVRTYWIQFWFKDTTSFKRRQLVCTHDSWLRRCRPCSRGRHRTSISCECTLRSGTAFRWTNTWRAASGDGRNGTETHPTGPAREKDQMENGSDTYETPRQSYSTGLEPTMFAKFFHWPLTAVINAFPLLFPFFISVFGFNLLITAKDMQILRLFTKITHWKHECFSTLCNNAPRAPPP